VGTALIVVGLTTGMLGFLDAFLSDAQKRSLNNWTIKTWYAINLMKENAWPLKVGTVLFINPVKRLAAFLDQGISAVVLNIAIVLFIWYILRPSEHLLYELWVLSIVLVPTLLFGPILFTFFLELIFSLIELCVRRIAESPKGVIAAVSAIITAVGAILKAL
jgi:hypothetical protein